MKRATSPTTTFMLRTTAGAFALSLSMAHAETSPYYIGARETITSDSNVLRTEAPKRDTISSTGIFAGIDQPFGRQRLSGNLSANLNRYKNNSQLNNTDGSLNLKLDWATIEHLFGDLQAAHSQSLYRDLGADNTVSKTLVRNSSAAFNVRLGVVTRWTAIAGINASRRRYTSEALQNSDLDQHGYNLGIRYVPSSLLNLGVALRRTDGEYPHAVTSAGIPVDSSFKRDDIDVTGTWSPTDTSTLNGRISHSKLAYSTSAEVRDSSLVTGAVSYQWHPGGRLSIDTSLVRDTDSGQSPFETTLLTGETFGGLSVDTRVSTSLVVNARYELTSKVQLGLEARHMDRDIDNALTALIGTPISSTAVRHAKDRSNVLGLSVSYDPTRTLHFSCGVTRIKRSIDDPDNTGLTYPYSANLANCTAQIEYRP